VTRPALIVLLCLTASCSVREPAAPPVPRIESPVEIGRLELGAVIGEMVLSPDGGSIYAIDFDDRRVIRVSTRDGEIKAEAQIGTAHLLSLSPDGRAVALAGPSKKGGRLLIFSALDLELQKTFTFELKPGSIAYATRDRLFVSSHVKPLVVMFDVKERRLEAAWRIPTAGAWLRVSPSGRTLIVSSRGRTPGLVRAYSIGPRAAWDAAAGPELFVDLECEGAGGRFAQPGDGRRLAFVGGALIGFTEGEPPELKRLGDLGAAIAVCSDPSRAEFGVSTPEGVFRLLGRSGKEIGRTPPMDRMITEMAMDASRRILFAFEGARNSVQLVAGSPRVTGDLVFYDLSEWLKARLPIRD
jgi:hypothetical protein